jgi:hypothetical protein
LAWPPADEARACVAGELVRRRTGARGAGAPQKTMQDQVDERGGATPEGSLLGWRRCRRGQQRNTSGEKRPGESQLSFINQRDQEWLKGSAHA